MSGSAVALSVLTGVLWVCLPAKAGDDDAVRQLLGFEKDEIAKFAPKTQPASQPDTFSATFGTYRDIGLISPGQASEGRYSLLREVFDRYNFLGPSNKTSYYERLRTGRILLTSGWFNKVFGNDWSGYDRLWMDVFSEDGQVRLGIELEDRDLPEPVVRTFAVPAGTWVTLEVDLAEAARRVHFDLGNVRCLDVMAVERIDAPRAFRVRLDNIRLVKAAARATLPVLRDETPLELLVRPLGERIALPAMDISRTVTGDGRGGSIQLPRPNSYALMGGTERAIGGFGDGGIMLAVGNRLYVSRDRGGHWTGLNGKPEPTIFSRDYRGDHRATAVMLGADVFAAYTTGKCAGGAGRTAAKFVPVTRDKGHWGIGPEVVLDSSTRHCHARFSLAKSTDGVLWCAWNHEGTDPAIPSGVELRVRWSPDGGRNWLDGGGSGVVAPMVLDGGPYLAPFRKSVACVWGVDRKILVAEPQAVRVRVSAVDGDRVTLAGGSKAGLRRAGEAIVISTAPGQPAAQPVLTLTYVQDDQAVAVPAPGQTATGVQVGDELLAMTWPATTILGIGRPPRSIASISGGDLFVVAQAENRKALVWRYDGKNAVDVTPGDFDCGLPVLVASGQSLVMFWVEGGKSVKRSVYLAGKWSRPEGVLDQEDIETLILPAAAERFIPIAVALKDRRTVLVVTVATP